MVARSELGWVDNDVRAIAGIGFFLMRYDPPIAFHGRICVACLPSTSAQYTAEWTITIPEHSSLAPRPPLHLALAMDRSGSMACGKLAAVQAAAIDLMHQLREEDHVALIAYARSVTVLSPAVPMTPTNRQQLATEIRSITPRGFTSITEGWVEAANRLLVRKTPSSVSRVLLLTDGPMRSGGIPSTEIIRQASKLRDLGINTSTFGLGTDFDERTLETIALFGGGTYYFQEHPASLRDAVHRELCELRNIRARHAVCTLTCPGGALTLLGDLPHESTADGIRVHLGDLCAGESRRIYAHYKSPAERACHASLSYTTIAGQVHHLTTEVSAERDLCNLADELAARAANVEMAAVIATVLSMRQEKRAWEVTQWLLHQFPHLLKCLAPPDQYYYQQAVMALTGDTSSAGEKHKHHALYHRRLARVSSCQGNDTAGRTANNSCVDV